MFYNGEEWFTVSLENYYEGAEEKGIIYNFTIKTDDCSIDGLIPYQTTRQEVIEKYGEPDEILQRSGNYCYGTTNNNSNPLGVIEEQRLTIRFDENDMVALVSITYANLTNEK